MTAFRDTVRRKTGEVIISAAALWPVNGMAQQERPILPQGLAGDILREERCTTSVKMPDMLQCNSDHASLKLLNSYARDVVEANKAHPPQTIKVSFPIAPGIVAVHEFSLEKLARLTDALKEKRIDAHYPVVFVAGDDNELMVMGTKGEDSGLIVISTKALNVVPVPEIVETVKNNLDQFKKNQAPGMRV